MKENLVKIMKKNYAMVVTVMMIAQSPGPLSKRFGQTVDAILRRDNIKHWNENKDNIVVVEENSNEEADNVRGEIADVEDVVADDVVIISDTPGNIVVKEEAVEQIIVVEGDDVEIEEGNDSVDYVSREDAVDDDIVYYKDAQVKYEFDEMRKENGVYFVPLRNPILIQTPVIKLLEFISSGNSAIVRVCDGFAKFVKNHEENVLNLVKKNKTLWFKNDIKDSALDSGFKSFLESDTLKVKILDDFTAFDTSGDFIDSTFCTPAEVRCILKISGVWFGSTEFGSIMSLVQTQLAQLPKCSIKPTRERKKHDYAREFE
jgi:hypothetical protein